MKTALVTGSSGQLGSYLVDATPRGWRSVGADLRTDRAHTNIVGDVRDASLFSGKSYDAIIHCAAQIEVPASMEDPAADAGNNILATVAMLELARRCGARFVYVSSAAVYGDPESVPIRETHPGRPLSPYGQSKLCGEHYCDLYSRAFGLSAAVVRPFNIYSPRQRYGVVKAFREMCAAGERPTVFGDGRQTRDYIHAADVARLLWTLCGEEGDGIFNACSGEGVTVLELARACMREAGISGEPDFLPARPGDIAASVGDPSRARRLLGFEPSVRLGDYLADGGGGAPGAGRRAGGPAVKRADGRAGKRQGGAAGRRAGGPAVAPRRVGARRG